MPCDSSAPASPRHSGSWPASQQTLPLRFADCQIYKTKSAAPIPPAPRCQPTCASTSTGRSFSSWSRPPVAAATKRGGGAKFCKVSSSRVAAAPRPPCRGRQKRGGGGGGLDFPRWSRRPGRPARAAQEASSSSSPGGQAAAADQEASSSSSGPGSAAHQQQRQRLGQRRQRGGLPRQRHLQLGHRLPQALDDPGKGGAWGGG